MEWAGLGCGGPPDEGLVFTLGGALLTSVRRNCDQAYRGGDLELDLLDRIGAEVELRATDDPVAGWKWVTDEIDAGRPVMVWADISALPYRRVRLQMSRHDIVIVGYDDEQRLAYVVDNDREHVQTVPYDDLARARTSTGFPVPTRHTTYVVKWPECVPNLRAISASALTQAALSLSRGNGPKISDRSSASVQGTGLDGVQVFVDDLRRWPEHLHEGDLHE